LPNFIIGESRRRRHEKLLVGAETPMWITHRVRFLPTFRDAYSTDAIDEVGEGGSAAQRTKQNETERIEWHTATSRWRVIAISAVCPAGTTSEAERKKNKNERKKNKEHKQHRLTSLLFSILSLNGI